MFRPLTEGSTKVWRHPHVRKSYLFFFSLTRLLSTWTRPPKGNASELSGKIKAVERLVCLVRACLLANSCLPLKYRRHVN